MQCSLFNITVTIIVDLPQSVIVCNFCGICLYVCVFYCMSDDNFQKPSCKKFILAYPVYLHGIQVKFVYEDSQVKVKVTGEKSKIPVPAM